MNTGFQPIREFTTPGATTTGEPASEGTDPRRTRADHKHDRANDAALHYMESLQFGHGVAQYPALAAPVASTLGTAGASGTALSVPRSDHIHDRNNDGALYWMSTAV